MSQNQLDLAIFTPTLEAGVGRVLFNIARGLVAKGYNVEIVTVKKGDFDILDTELRIINLSANRTFTSLFKLMRYVSDKKPKVLLSAIYHANLIAGIAHFLSRSESKLVFSEHIALKQSLKRESFVLRTVLKFLMRIFFRYATLVISVSEEAGKDLVDLGLSVDKLKTIYNPVISESLYIQAAAPVDHPWFEKNIPIILGVGRLTDQKDFPTLIKAFALLSKSIPAKLMIVGEGSERKNLEKLVEEYSLSNDAILLGHIKNPFPIFKNSNIFVLSSKYEGLPTVLIEALALGLQVVSTDCPSGPKEILGNKLGQLVPVGDVGAMFEALKQAVLTPRPLADKSDLERFGIEYAASQYEKVLFLT